MGHGTGTWRRLVRELGLALLTAGVVVLLFVAYELVGTNVTEEHNQARLAKEFHHALATTTTTTSPAPAPTTTDDLPTTTADVTPTTTGGRAAGKKKTSAGTRTSAGKTKTTTAQAEAVPVVPPGGAIDHLQVPAIGVDRYVVQGVDEADLQMGPGHYPGTPLPGQPGNVGIAGHRTTFGAPFFELDQLVKGDLVYLTDTDGNTWAYTVERKWVVAPSDVSVLDPTTGAELTLTTCNPKFEATSRLVVRAALWYRYRPGTRLPVVLPAKTSAAPHRLRRGGTVTTLPVTTLPVTTLPVSTLPAGTGSTTSTTPASTGPAGPKQGPSPTGDNPTVGPSAGPGQADVLTTGGTGAWAGALLWGALALACWVATRLLAIRRRRWASAGVVAAGSLLCLLPLWFTFGNVVNLLPSNI